MKTKRYFSREFKLKAIELSHKRAGVGIAAKELGISLGLLSRWRSEFYNHKKEAFPGMGNITKPKDKKLSEIQAKTIAKGLIFLFYF
jgi:transposase